MPDDDVRIIAGGGFLALSEQNNIDILFDLENLDFEACVQSAIVIKGTPYISFSDYERSQQFKVCR